ncbi:hypothetical protein HJFPF1_10010 [Paramyrothecium foliicola]|nr:hypothetical protein HJFPF1_10010 [Paramyrothecium foliicola]
MADYMSTESQQIRLGIELEFMIANHVAREAEVDNDPSLEQYRDGRFPDDTPKPTFDRPDLTPSLNSACMLKVCTAIADCGLPVATSKTQASGDPLAGDPSTDGHSGEIKTVPIHLDSGTDTDSGSSWRYRAGTDDGSVSDSEPMYQYRVWNPEYASKHKSGRFQYNYWYVTHEQYMTDNQQSMHPNGTPKGPYDWFAMEINSPIVSVAADLVKDLGKITASLRNKTKVWLNGECGMHIHASPLGRKPTLVMTKRIVALIFLLEKPLIQQIVHPERKASPPCSFISEDSRIAVDSYRFIMDKDHDLVETINELAMFRGSARNRSDNEPWFFKMLQCIFNQTSQHYLRKGLKRHTPFTNASHWEDGGRCALDLSHFDTIEFRYLQSSFDETFISFWVDFVQCVFSIAAMSDQDYNSKLIGIYDLATSSKTKVDWRAYLELLGLSYWVEDLKAYTSRYSTSFKELDKQPPEISDLPEVVPARDPEVASSRDLPEVAPVDGLHIVGARYAPASDEYLPIISLEKRKNTPFGWSKRRIWIVAVIAVLAISGAVVGGTAATMKRKDHSQNNEPMPKPTSLDIPHPDATPTTGSDTGGATSTTTSDSKEGMQTQLSISTSFPDSLRASDSACHGTICTPMLSFARSSPQSSFGFLFALGEDGDYWYRETDGDKWTSGWESLGGPFQGQLSVTSMSPGRLDIFGVGKADRTIRTKSYQARTWDKEWTDLGQRAYSAPATCSPHEGETYLISTSSENNMIWRHREDDDWGSSDWKTGSDGFLASPPTTACSEHGMDILSYGESADPYQLRVKRWNGKELSSWQEVGGNFRGEPVAVRVGSNRTVFYGVGYDGEMYYKTWLDNDELTDEDLLSLGGKFQSVPSVLVTGEERVDLVAVGTDGKLKHKAFVRGEWATEWGDLGGFFNSAPVVARMKDEGGVAVFGIGPGGGIIHGEWTIGVGHSWGVGEWFNDGGKFSTECVHIYQHFALSIPALSTMSGREVVDFSFQADVVNAASVTHLVTGRILKALSDGGVDIYAVTASVWLGSKFSTRSSLESTVHSHIAAKKGYQGFLAKTLSIGWGHSAVPVEMSRTRAGANALLLIGALAAGSSHYWAAQCLSNMLTLWDFDASSIPNVDCLKIMVAYLTPFVQDLGFSKVLEHITTSVLHQLSRLLGISDVHTSAIKQLIFTTGRDEKSYMVVKQRGAWLAAFASHILGMSVKIVFKDTIIWQSAGHWDLQIRVYASARTDNEKRIQSYRGRLRS